MYCTYILQSQKDSTYYIGHSSNIEKRLIYHNKGKSSYTSRKTPWKLVYKEDFPTKGEAYSRELFLKKQKNSDFYTRLIQSQYKAI